MQRHITHQSNFVFGYGSLVNLTNLQTYLKRNLVPVLDYVICGLKGFNRCWNVAMDNRIDLPNYKYYIHRETGNRIDGFVTFLNISPYQNKTITGILFRVGDRELNNLDRRERNYQRIDVTNMIDIPIQGKAWTYIGLEQAKKRYQVGLEQKKAIIAQNYLNSVRDAYLSLGSHAFTNYIATTEQPTIPLLNLERCKVIGSRSEIKQL